jgi:hypothetical protein
MMSKRPHLPADLDLDAMTAIPGAGRPQTAFHEAPAPREMTPSPAVMPGAASADGRRPADLKSKAIATTLYLLPEDHRRLRRLAADRDVAAQTLLLDALDMLFGREGQGPVQRWEPRRKVRPA